MDLQILWFCLVGFFFAGYFVLEGFDFGVGMLLPFLPRNEEDRSAMLRSIGPVWDGNEVWLVVAGGAMFAAFPAWYATMFSGFYIALLLLLALLIVRVLSFEWRERHEDSRWLGVWAWANTIGSIGAALIWGVAFSTLLYGTPINSNGDFSGSFWDLFNVYTAARRDRGRAAVRVPRRDVHDAAHDGRALPARGLGGAAGSRSPPRSSAPRS